ncbi:MAG: ribosome small subunit-dependent GTPase A [Actinomycetales bacterium]|nr:ribosome small subunit-dependent GTPase A [Actinomycetales bacterium]
MRRAHLRLDEDDVRVRPGKGKSRPRSKDRPAHASASSGTVITVDRGRFTVVLDTGDSVHAIKARELGRKGLAVGDQVDLVGDLSGEPDAIARVIRRHERTSTLRRTADDADPVERVIVANATQLGIVTATANPEPSLGLIDRALVAAYDARLRPMLLVTKSDLRSPEDLLEAYRPLGLEVLVVQRGEPSAQVRAALRDEVTVVVGHSGVGKSTLVNALVPGADRSTGRVNAVTGKGRHTSTSAIALALPGGGWIIDTPGIRSFGLAHVDPARVISAFPDLEAGTTGCPRACTHDEPDCDLDHWAAGQPEATVQRLASMRRLLASRQSANDEPSARRQSEQPS